MELSIKFLKLHLAFENQKNQIQQPNKQSNLIMTDIQNLYYYRNDLFNCRRICH
ncbi:unnamed protein product [Paramecium sonneborni]|uniref:Uncharacterized protein n=1 Tax=Paramecium sonneborni TaxID=65129 RepID=A0A8S1JXR7_9CILI|nr:unnamed protein product [Paramecium sonneborni]